MMLPIALCLLLYTKIWRPECNLVAVCSDRIEADDAHYLPSDGLHSVKKEHVLQSLGELA